MSALTVHEALTADGEEGGVVLLCPTVGEYLHPPAVGELLAAGETCGWLRILGALHAVRVPEGVAGRVTRRASGPRGHREPLLWLDAVGSEATTGATATATHSEQGLVFCAPLDGRFFRRPSPDAEPYAQDGEVLVAGRAIGLLEVMKTFSPLRYEAVHGLPARARLLRFLVADGDEVAEGQPLAELEAERG